MPHYQQVAKEKYGKNVAFDWNSQRDFVLCRQSDTTKLADAFFVFDVKTDSVILDRTYDNGSHASWKDAYLLEIKVFGQRTKTYLFDVKARKVVSTNENTND